MNDLTKAEPLVLAGAARDWPATSLWTFEWLARTHGDMPVTVSHGSLTCDDGFQTRDTTLRGYLEDLQGERSADSGFVGTVDLGEQAPELRAHTRFPRASLYQRFSRTNYWIGPAGWLSQLHCDFAHNYLAQIRGRKRVQLYRPSMVPASDHFRSTWYSCSTTWDYPDAEPAEPRPPPCFDVVLEPGDILFIPYGWWHRASYLEASIGVNQWWMTPGMVAARAPRIARSVVTAARIRWLLYRIAAQKR